MIDMFTSDQRLSGDKARSVVATLDRIETHKVAMADLTDATQARADAILAKAEVAAQSVLDQAQKYAVAIRDAAEDHLPQLHNYVEYELSQRFSCELAQIATHLTEVVLGALDKVVGDIGADAMVRAAVLHILQSHPQIAASRLRVAPDGVTTLADLPLDVVADPGLRSGACVLETAQGMVDLGAGAQLLALKAALVLAPVHDQTTRGAA